MDLGWPQIIVALVAAQRIGEVIVSRRNTARLKASGAVEYGAAHYPFFVLLHGTWLAVLFLSTPADASINPGWLVLFATLQGLRGWVLLSLGFRWSTRVLVLPREDLVRRGPYRWVRHPNYLIVIGEIAILPLVFGELAVALAFSLVNAALLAHRMRVEEAALAVAGESDERN